MMELLRHLWPEFSALGIGGSDALSVYYLDSDGSDFCQLQNKNALSKKSTSSLPSAINSKPKST